MQKYSLAEFTNDPERYGSTERFLHLTIEAVNDVGNHIIAGLGLGEVDWYSNIPVLLHQANYIDQEMQET